MLTNNPIIALSSQFASVVANSVKQDSVVSGLSDGTTLTLSHSLSAGTGRAVVVLLGVEATGGVINTPTYNGVAMTQVTGIDNAPNFARIYIMLDAQLPSAAGSYDVVFGTSGGGFGATVMGLYEAEQVVPSGGQLSNRVANNSDSQSFSVTFSEENGVVLCLFSTGNQTPDFVAPPTNYSLVTNLTPSSQRFGVIQRFNAPNPQFGVNFGWGLTGSVNRIAASAVGINPGPGSLTPSARSHTLEGTSDGLTYDTWVYRPAGFNVAASNSYPCLIFLHGNGPQGSGANSLLTFDAPTVTSEINLNNFNEDIVVLSPYLPTSDWFATTVNDVVQNVISNADRLKIDTSRIYLTGLSLGGIGISLFLGDETNYTAIAGAFPIAGGSGWNASEAQRVVNRNVILRGWLGSAEPNSFATIMTNERDTVNAIQANYFELNIVAGGTHSSSTWGPPYQDYTATGMYNTILTN